LPKSDDGNLVRSTMEARRATSTSPSISQLRHRCSRWTPHDVQRMTQGQCGSLLLHCNGLSPSTLCRSPGALPISPHFTPCIRSRSRTTHATKCLRKNSKRRLRRIGSCCESVRQCRCRCLLHGAIALHARTESARGQLTGLVLVRHRDFNVAVLFTATNCFDNERQEFFECVAS